MSKPGTLYVVATPIGNLGDISSRAREILEKVDIVACEDTRTSGRLLARLGIKASLASYHEHNESVRASELLDRIREGESVALISDAGTPLMSDPGYRLVSVCREAGINIYAIPGPCAAIAALSVSGLPTDRFLFVGFLPSKKSAQAKALDELSNVTASLIFYIPVNSAPGQLKLIFERLGDRPAFLVREMTKLYETSLSGNLSAILQQLADFTLKGEITLVVGGSCGARDHDRSESLDTRAYLYGLMASRGLSASEAAQRCVADLGAPRKQVYRESLEVKSLIDGSS
jgi:16S rRNA (cytidine1402-2'-O)-methyltransferase